MTPATRRNYERTLSKARMAMLPIQLGDCEPIDLFNNPAMWLLMLESFERLLAVVMEGSGCAVEWVDHSGASP